MENVIQNAWQKSKLIVKGIVIGILALLLLIPTSFVQNLVREREARQKEAATEISSKWADSQNLTGPILVIPYTRSATDNSGKPITIKSLAYFLPDNLNIGSTVKPVKKYRGIYEVMLYSSLINFKGNFGALPLEKLNLKPSDLIWNEAYICLNVTDAKGLKDELKVKWNDSTLTLSPSYINNAVLKNGFVSPVMITEATAASGFSFSSQININGSQQLLFTPIGKQTILDMQSSWPDPSFTGNQLPDTSSVSDKGFAAQWKSFSHTRNFPQAWKDDS
jgi:inner membrane protein